MFAQVASFFVSMIFVQVAILVEVMFVQVSPYMEIIYGSNIYMEVIYSF